MRSFKKLFLFLVELHAAFMVCALIFKRRYAAQELGIDQVNAIGILGGAEEFSASQDFRGGYVRAMIGGVELDLTNAAIEAPPRDHRGNRNHGRCRDQSPAGLDRRDRSTSHHGRH